RPTASGFLRCRAVFTEPSQTHHSGFAAAPGARRRAALADASRATADRVTRLDGSGTATGAMLTLSRPTTSSGEDGTPLSSTQRKKMLAPLARGEARLIVVVGTLVTPTVLGTMTCEPEPLSTGFSAATLV